MYPSQYRDKAVQLAEEEAVGYQGNEESDPDELLNELNHDELIEHDLQEVQEEIMFAEGQPGLEEPQPPLVGNACVFIFTRFLAYFIIETNYIIYIASY